MYQILLGWIQNEGYNRNNNLLTIHKKYKNEIKGTFDDYFST